MSASFLWLLIMRHSGEKHNGSHCMHEWCGWLEKTKIAWLSQDDGDAPLAIAGELRMSHAGKCVWVHNSRLGAYLCR